MKVIVLGSSGFLGSALLRKLPKDKFWVGGVSRTSLQSPSGPASFSPDFYTELVERLEADVVVNCVALTDIDYCELQPRLALEINSCFPGELARKSEELGFKLLHISSDAVFSGDKGSPYTEVDEPNPGNSYGKSKLLGELSVMSSANCPLVVRTNFFGWSPDSSRGILDFFVGMMARSATVKGFHDYIVTSLYIDHLADLIARLLLTNQSGLFHAGAKSPMSKLQFAELVAKHGRFDTSLVRSASQADSESRVVRGRNLSLDSSALGELLALRIPSTEEGILQAFKDRPENIAN